MAQVPTPEIEPARIQISVSAPEAGGVNFPVYVTMELPERFSQLPAEGISVILRERDGTGTGVSGQIVIASGGKAQLWWILPRAEAGGTSVWTATLSHREKAGRGGFSWKNEPGNYLDLLFNGRKVVRYMYAYDESTPERLEETNKPYHHVFNAEGENLLTNGPGGLYPHHRGLFIGWNKLEFGGKEYNLWAMDEAAQRHQEFLKEVAGAVMASSESLINWNDPNGEPIILEQREITVFRQPEPSILLLDFRTRLEAVRGEVYLNGDPEHGGFQFRAHNDVSRGSEQAVEEAVRVGEQVPDDLAEVGEDTQATYFFHTDGIDPREDQNLPWVAMSYGLNGRRYNVQYMNHPDNPQPTVYSAYRDYGRFGAFFKKKIGSGETLMLRYRIWIVEGDMPTREELAEKYSAFIDSPGVEVLSYD